MNNTSQQLLFFTKPPKRTFSYPCWLSHSKWPWKDSQKQYFFTAKVHLRDQIDVSKICQKSLRPSSDTAKKIVGIFTTNAQKKFSKLKKPLRVQSKYRLLSSSESFETGDFSNPRICINFPVFRKLWEAQFFMDSIAKNWKVNGGFPNHRLLKSNEESLS